MPCVLTQGYILDCRDAFGGLNTCYLMEYDNLATVTLTVGVVTALTKVTGKKFYQYKLIAHTGEADEAMTGSRENGTNQVVQHVKFPINKMNTAVRNELLLLAQNRLVIVITDENGTSWMYGKDYGLILKATTAKTGKVLADRNGYELDFEGEEKYLAVEVNATVVAALLTVGP